MGLTGLRGPTSDLSAAQCSDVSSPGPQNSSILPRNLSSMQRPRQI
jgi:hypothetical protein